jgi:hypothetical protein
MARLDWFQKTGLAVSKGLLRLFIGLFSIDLFGPALKASTSIKNCLE